MCFDLTQNWKEFGESWSGRYVVSTDVVCVWLVCGQYVVDEGSWYVIGRGS